MSQTRQFCIAVIGTGGVGACFLQQLSEVSARLAKQSPPTHLHTILIGRSKTMLYNEDYKPLPLSNWQQDLASSKQPALADNKLVEYLNSAPHKTILVDNTSSENVAKLYPTLLASSNGISVVTPNKKAFSSGLELYQNIQRSAANSSGQSIILHESTVGAGLPIISTLRDLVDTGDTVEKIEGVFSGTMSFLFNSFMPLGGGGGSFSAEVIKAKDLGYTEPDPRDDLNGLDVARKLTILARVIGLSVSGPTSFPVQSLVPKELEDCSADDFVSKLAQFDDRMAKLKQDAAAKNKVVRYVGSIDVAKNDIKVGVETFDASHPIAALKGSDNIINFYTKRYGSNPLIIQGAGAGGDVTAMGTMGDLLKVIAQLK